MAEIFGVIAGGIGAGSLAIQLIDKAGKLSTLLKSIRDAPKDIYDMLVEIELLTEILSEIEELQKLEPQMRIFKTAERIHKLCQAAADDLRSLLEDLDACYDKISHPYSWKSIRTYLKSDKIKSMIVRAKRAFKLLMMVNQIYLHSLQSHKLDSILDNVARSSSQVALTSVKPAQNTAIHLNASRRESPDLETSTVKWHSVTSYWILIGNIHIGCGTLQRRQKRKTLANTEQPDPEIASWRFQFHPAIWSGQKGSVINGFMQHGIWQYTITPYNLQPSNAPIFFACKNRELDSVRRLLDEGLASPFDISPQGHTPLHIAAEVAAVEICRLLIERGADGNYVSVPGGPTPLMSLAQATTPKMDRLRCHDPDSIRLSSSTLITTTTSQEIHDTVRLLVEKGKCDPMTGKPDTLGNQSALTLWCGSSETFQWLIQQEHFEVDLNMQDEARGRSVYHTLAHSTKQNGSRLISDVLWSQSHLSRMTTCRDQNGESILHAALFTLCLSLLITDGKLDGTQKSSLELVRGLVKAGSDVHARNNKGVSPLMYAICSITFWQIVSLDLGQKIDREEYLISSMEFFDKQRHTLIKQWLSVLADGGYDLREYARNEQSFYSSETIEGWVTLSSEGVQDSSCLIKYNYGSDQNDVTISCEVKFEERAGTEPLSMPGSWVETST